MDAPFLDWQKNDHFALLGITRMAGEDEIRKAYRLRALECHPDRFQDEAQRADAALRFQKLTEARDTLLDAERRSAYEQEQQWVQQAWLDAMASQYQVPINPPPPRQSFRDTLHQAVEAANERERGQHADFVVGDTLGYDSEEEDTPQRGIPEHSRKRTAAFYYAQGLRYAARGHYRRALYALNNAKMLDPEIVIPPHVMSKIRTQAYYSKR
ncbi:MAG: J domain-containing protein [Candidatus Sericytochromatia bacterium]